MFERIACNVCNAEESHIEFVEEVFKVDGRYVLVGRVPSTVCQRCGERSFSRETTERVRLPNPPPNLVGVGFVVLQDVFVVDSASHMLRLGRKEGFGRRF